MSLIVNSPITLPVVAKDVPTPISGTRGLVAKYDGWYDYQSDGTETKIPSPNDNLKFVNGKGIVFGVPDNYDPESVYKNRINNNGIEMAVGGGETHIEVGKVEIVCGDKTHNLSEKANTSDVFLKSGDVVLADGKKVSLSSSESGNDGTLTIRPTGISLSRDTSMGTNDVAVSAYSGISVGGYGVDISINTIDGEQHKLSEKADKTEVFLPSKDIALESGKKISITNSNDTMVATLSGEELKIAEKDNDYKYARISANDVEVKTYYTDETNAPVFVTHKLSEKVNSSNVLTKTNTAAFTPTGDYQPATKKYVDDIVIEAGGGDMLRTVYDKDKTGTVDDSKKLGGQLPSYYSKTTDIGTLADLNTINKTNIVSAVNEKWTGKVYTVEVGNDWEIHTVTSNGEEKLGSYYQEIAVEGITSVGQPFVDVVLPDDDVQAKQQLTDYQCVSRVRTENGKIILKCFEDRPSSSFTIRVLVLGNVL